jgi:hypothetical protein
MLSCFVWLKGVGVDFMSVKKKDVKKVGMMDRRNTLVAQRPSQFLLEEMPEYPEHGVRHANSVGGKHWVVFFSSWINFSCSSMDLLLFVPETG